MEADIELIFPESIRINGDDKNDPHVRLNTTLQQKNNAFPTDVKWYKSIITKGIKTAEDSDIELHQKYSPVLKRLSLDQRFRNHLCWHFLNHL